MSTISAGTLLSNALVQTGDTSGNLVFQTNGNTTAMTIDTNQNVTYANGVSFTGVIGGNGANISSINASNLTSGTVATARLASGTANSSTYLRGDQTWAVLSAPNDGVLTLNTSGTGLSGSQTFSANQSSNVTFTVTSNANSANGASTIVARDSSGNFTANAVTLTTGSFSGGSNTAPSITFTGDTNTGIYSPAADTIAFTEGGVESMRIDGSGNVGIGTSSVSGAKMDVNGGLLVSGALTLNQTDKLYLEYSSNIATLGSYGNTAGSGIVRIATGGGGGSGGTERMRITSGGNVGIGTTSPQGRLDVVGMNRISSATPSFPSSGSGLEIYYDGTNDNGRLQSYDRTASSWKDFVAAANNLIFQTSGSERMRIASNGALGFAGANYGSSGQVLTSNGSGGTPSWGSVSGTVTVTGGSQAYFGIRAFAGWDGNGGVSIRRSYSISSITYLGTGSYQINYSTAFPDANYCVYGNSTSRVGVSATFFVTTFRRDTDTRVANTTTTSTVSTCGDTSGAVNTVDVQFTTVY